MTLEPYTPPPVPAIVETFVDALRQHKPPRATGIQALGYTLRLLSDEGMFRRTYEVLGHQCIVKVPRRYRPKPSDPLWKNPKNHSRIEVETLAMIATGSRFAHLRRHVPQVYFSDINTGIVVMPKYHPRPPETEEWMKRERRLLDQIFRDSLGKYTADFGANNMMQDDHGNLIVVDLGY